MNLLYDEHIIMNFEFAMVKSIITIYSKLSYKVYYQILDTHILKQIYNNINNIEIIEYKDYVIVKTNNSHFEINDFYSVNDSVMNSLFSFYENCM